jgi:Uma2 family endonuclease
VTTVLVQDDHQPEGAMIPGWVQDLKSFTRWAESSEFPERGRISFIRGTIRIDLSMEQLFIHNRLKVRITGALEVLATSRSLGYVFGDGARVNNELADLSVEPDAMFVSFDCLEAGRARLVHGSQGGEEGYLRIEGSPDVVVEVVSESSERKDTIELREDYFTAGVIEYWLVDAREKRASFEILKRGGRGFIATRPQAGGWLKSVVFGKSFRLVQAKDQLGNPQFTLEHRD